MEKVDYKYIYQVIESVTKTEDNLVANLANISSILKEQLGHHWVGFYLVEGDELVLGPFQGPLACTRIPFGKGVCGVAWSEAQVIRVEDVHSFQGHITCSSLTNSEIVIPILKDNTVVAVLDIDSVRFNAFGIEDELELAKISKYLSKLF